MRGFLNHFLIRFKYSVGSWGTLISIVGTSCASLFFWPGSTDSSAAGWQAGTSSSGMEEPYLGLLLMTIWMWLWPALPVLSVSGLITSTRKKVFSMGPVPTLPVGYRTRAVAEAAIVALFVLVIQLAAIALLKPEILFIGHFFAAPVSTGALLLHSLTGTAIIFPILLSWALPARSFEVKWFKPLFWIALVLACLKLGMLATPLLAVATALLLSALILLTSEFEFNLPRLARNKLRRPDSHFRPYRPSFNQLVRDTWWLPLYRLGWFVLVLLLIEIICIVLDYNYDLHDYTVYLGTTFVLSFFLPFVALRPFGSKQPIAGVWGAPGFEPGDFLRAWTVLPVRPIWVLRAVWVYGMVLGLFIWAAAVFVGAFTTWLEVGRFALLDSDGDPVGHLMLPHIFAVPCVAGILVNATAGSPTRSFVSAVCLVAMIVSNVLLIGFRVPVYFHVLVFAALLFAGGIAPLKYVVPIRSLNFGKAL